MKAAATLSVVKVGSMKSASGDQVLIQVKDSPSGMKTDAVYDQDLVDAVERLHGELRRKEGELRRKDEELLAARDQFSELELCSREVEQELESEISRLNRLNNELENENRSLARRLENELQHVRAQPSTRNDEVAQLRQRLQRLEQQNDDLQTSVRRLESTREDLDNALERAEEHLVFAQQEFDDFKDEADEASKQLHAQIRDLTANVKMHQTFLSCTLQTGIPYESWNSDNSTATIKKAQEPQSSDTDDTDEEAMTAATMTSWRVAAPTFVKRNE